MSGEQTYVLPEQQNDVAVSKATSYSSHINQ